MAGTSIECRTYDCACPGRGQRISNRRQQWFPDGRLRGHRGIESTYLGQGLVWVRPNDFLIRGGAGDTDVRLHLAYRIDLTLRTVGRDAHHIAIFVDAGSGALIGGVETA